MQTTHDLSSVTNLVQPSHHLPAPSACPVPSQTLQAMGPAMTQRPDCRLALSAIVPSIQSQTNTNITYPSCMMGNSNHTGHMEQADPINYEPYIWSF